MDHVIAELGAFVILVVTVTPTGDWNGMFICYVSDDANAVS